MRRPEILTLLVVLFAAVSCNEAPEPDSNAANPGDEEHFAAFARDLFAELRNEPIDSTIDAEIGLFGDLSVDSGERTVMRQYRYRIDSSALGPVAFMAFQVRDTSRRDLPVPVVLSFDRGPDMWRLKRAVFGDAVFDKGQDAGDHAVHNEPDDREGSASGQMKTPLHESLGAHLDVWLEAAISRAREK